jgi:hypothetical protein
LWLALLGAVGMTTSACPGEADRSMGPRPDATSSKPDAGEGGDVDAGTGDRDALAKDGASPLDQRVEQGDAPTDGQPCGAGVDQHTLVLLDLDRPTGTTVPDSTGNHPAELRGQQAQAVEGPPGCGQALAFPAGDTATTYVELPDSPDWDLTEGAVDFWVRFDTSSADQETQGVLSRDAVNVELEGHLSMLRACDGSLVVRLQRAGSTHYQCSAPIADGVWTHVGLNFGAANGLQLFVDGTVATRTDPVPCRTGTCGASGPYGIDGNDNPWVIGALAWGSAEGSATPVGPGLGGAIDHFRVSSVPRDFAAP